MTGLGAVGAPFARRRPHGFLEAQRITILWLAEARARTVSRCLDPCPEPKGGLSNIRSVYSFRCASRDSSFDCWPSR
jgi:hypothetical protein